VSFSLIRVFKKKIMLTFLFGFHYTHTKKKKKKKKLFSSGNKNLPMIVSIVTAIDQQRRHVDTNNQR
jgi:hypothetical protein